MQGGITLIIILATVVASISALNNPELHSKLLYSPYKAKRGEWYRIFSHAFVHAGFMHLFINMFVLYNFGSFIEDELEWYFDGQGKLMFLLLYFGGVVFAAIPGYIKHSDNPNYLSHGASGAVSAVVFSFIMLFPGEKLMLLIPPIPMPAFVFGIGYLILEYYLDKRGGGNVAHDAHFWGALYGILFIIAIDSDSVSRLIDEISRMF